MTQQRRRRRVESGPNIQWSGFGPLFDSKGREWKRFYRLETLAAAVDGAVRSKDWFIVPSIQAILGPAEVTSLSFRLFLENRDTLIFRLDAMNARRKRASLAFVAAKNDKECSATARAGHAHLRTLYDRAPEYVLRPYRGGTVYLPDRHRREAHGRVVYAYVTQWLPGYEALGIDRNMQFCALGERRHTFTIAETEALKAQVVTLMAGAYDAKRRNGMGIPDVMSGDVLVRRATRGLPKLKLIGCRRLVSGMSPVKALHAILAGSWDCGGRHMPLSPSNPETLWEGLAAALGREIAGQWIRQYLDAVENSRLTPATVDLAELREIVMK
ncbi:MAG TPA: hypothetical protein ENN65_03520 [Candidatus Hydrogenedentes bacterium]|nr:hypothetical protein [Candidatus Hydrogenedentota bacterium]